MKYLLSGAFWITCIVLHAQMRSSALFGPIGTQIATFKGKEVRLWNVLTGKCERVFRQEGDVFNVSFSKDGAILLCDGLFNPTAWDTRTGNVLRQFKSDLVGELFADLDNSSRLICVFNKTEFQVLDLQEGHEIFRSKGSFRGFGSFDSTVVVLEDLIRLKIVSLRTGRAIKQLDLKNGESVGRIRTNQDALMVYADASVRILSSSDLKERISLQQHPERNDRLFSLLSSDGRVLATTSYPSDTVITFREVSTGKTVSKKNRSEYDVLKWFDGSLTTLVMETTRRLDLRNVQESLPPTQGILICQDGQTSKYNPHYFGQFLPVGDGIQDCDSDGNLYAYANDFGNSITIYATATNSKVMELSSDNQQPLELDSLWNLRKNIGELERMNWLGNFFMKSGEATRAAFTYHLALRMAEKEFSKSDKRYLLALFNLGNAYLNIDRSALAIPYLRECIIGLAKLYGNSDERVAECLSVLGTCYSSLYDFKKADSCLTLSIEIESHAKAKFSKNQFKATIRLASFNIERENFGRALQILKELSYNRSKYIDVDSLDKVAMLNLFSVVYERLGDEARSATYNIKSIKLVEREGLQKAPIYSLIIENSARRKLREGKLDSAMMLASNSLLINEEKFGKFSYRYARSLMIMAYVKSLLGEEPIKVRLEYSDRALQILKELLSHNDPEYLLDEYIDFFFHNYNNGFKLKAKIADDILSINKVFHGRSTLATRLSYEAAAMMLGSRYYSKDDQSGSKDFDEVFRLFSQGNANVKQQIKFLFPFLSEAAQAKFYNANAPDFYKFNSFALSKSRAHPVMLDEIYNNQLAIKALLFYTSNHMHQRILESKNSEMVTLYQRWKEDRQAVAETYQRRLENLPASGNLEALEQELESLEEKLFSKSDYQVFETDTVQVHWKDILGKLGDTDAAMEIVRQKHYDFRRGKWYDYESYFGLLISRATTEHPILIRFGQDSITNDRFLKYYSNSIKNRTEDSLSYNIFWRPLKKYLNGIKKLYLSPDGVYNQINLLALKNPKNGQYVLDEGIDIQLVSNTRDLLSKSRDKLKLQQQGILIGYPAYNRKSSSDTTRHKRSVDHKKKVKIDTTQRFFDGEGISELPGTKAEIEGIEAIFRKNNLKVRVIEGEKATESFLKGVQSLWVLHLATHGFFLNDVEREDQAKVTEPIVSAVDTKYELNPLFRSGLLFAHAAQAIKSGGDGILTAYEVMNMDLRNTDLVVLSACETGLGVIKNGEGVYGLQRAFQTAGAKTVLISLWSVDDEVTKELMALFYDNWLTKNQPEREAFFNAQRKIKLKYPDPYYWAPFVMVGL